jgi:hypothetical protein
MTKEEIQKARFLMESIDTIVHKFVHDIVVQPQEKEDIYSAWTQLKDKMLQVLGKRVYNDATRE